MATHSILTIHNKVITRNYRLSLAQADGRNWVLRISNAHESDRGWYMCQVNTDPMRFQKAYVEVVGTSTSSIWRRFESFSFSASPAHLSFGRALV